MRYSAALVLGTVALGEAAGLRHASFHARRQAEASKRDIADVDWSKVSYDLSGVDWSKVNYGNPTPSTAPAAPAAPVAPEPAAPSVSKPDTTTSNPSPPATEKPTTVVGAVTDYLKGVDTLIKKIGVSSAGVNAVANNGGLWIGEDSAWKAQFINDANRDLVLFCWKADGFTGMTINVHQPAISVGLSAGETVTVSFAENVPAACAQAFDDTTLSNFGGLFQTWSEFTFGPQGAFDVSRNVNMNGNPVSMKGSKCTSNMESCVFHCQDTSVASCETGYTLAGMDSPGCGGGFDANMNGVGGGCSMGATGETVKVTFS